MEKGQFPVAALPIPEVRRLGRLLFVLPNLLQTLGEAVAISGQDLEAAKIVKSDSRLWIDSTGIRTLEVTV